MRVNEAACFDTDRATIVLKLIDWAVLAIARRLDARRRRADVAVLRGLSDRELMDLGLSRCDIDNIV